MKIVDEKLSEASESHLRDVSEFRTKQKEQFELSQKSLQSSLENHNDKMKSHIQQCEQDIELKLSKLKENHQEDVIRLDAVNERLEEVQTSVEKLSERKDLGKTVDGLGVRVNELTDTMNQFVQNVLIIKRLSRMVSGENGLESRLEKIEKSIAK